MSTDRPDEHRPDNPFAVPLSALEDDAHVDAEERVEEIGEPPNPDVIPEERRRIENLLKWGAPGS